MAFDPGAWKITTATAGWLLSSERNAYSEAPSSMRATSRRRVIWLFVPVFRTMSPNSSSVTSRPSAWIESVKSRAPGCGGAPIAPAETCTFCSRIARTISPAVIARAATWSGSSQMRIE